MRNTFPGRLFAGLLGAFLLWTPVIAQEVAPQCEYPQAKVLEYAAKGNLIVKVLNEKEAHEVVDKIAARNNGVRPPTEDFNSGILAYGEGGSFFFLFKDGCYLVRATLTRETLKDLLGETV